MNNELSLTVNCVKFIVKYINNVTKLMEIDTQKLLLCLRILLMAGGGLNSCNKRKRIFSQNFKTARWLFTASKP